MIGCGFDDVVPSFFMCQIHFPAVDKFQYEQCSLGASILFLVEQDDPTPQKERDGFLPYRESSLSVERF